MRLLDPPSFTGEQLRDACVPEIQSERRRYRILDDAGMVLAAEAEFRMALLSGDARTLTPADFTPQVKKDMVWLYENRLMKRWGKPHRAAIMAATAGECAFCHIAKAKTLDHSIPKSAHPRLAVEPMNLVPACRDCNLNRGVGSGKCSVSPYADAWVEEVPWLQARIPELACPEQLEFFVAPHLPISPSQQESLDEFFEDADLGSRYALLASKAFALSAKRIRRAGAHPVDFAVEVLTECAEDALEELGLNRWETAAYAAWSGAAASIDWLRVPCATV